MTSSPIHQKKKRNKFFVFGECPLTYELMVDPVVDPEGHSYERQAIEKWLANHSTSPITRSPLSVDHLTPNRALKEAIQQLLQFQQEKRRKKLKNEEGSAVLFRAMYPFQGQDETELSFKVGDIITITKTDGDWLEGLLDGKRGLLPANYVKRI